MTGQPRPEDLAAAIKQLTLAAINAKPGAQPGEYLVTMPLLAAQALGVYQADGGGYAGLLISRALGERVHITGWRGLTDGDRPAYQVEVTLRLHTAAWDEVFAQLIEAGYGKDPAVAVMAEAMQFPGRWAYTGDRRRAVAYRMPGGTWKVEDTAESEARIAARRTRRGSMLRAQPPRDDR